MSVDDIFALPTEQERRAAVEQLAKKAYDEGQRAAFAEGQILALKHRAEWAEQDAARYRWLRDHLWSQALTTVFSLPAVWKVDYAGEEGNSMDAAIDAAMKEEK